MELQRNAVNTSDYQMIKLQEVTDQDKISSTDQDAHHQGADADLAKSNCRVPRTFEIEVRGNLIDQCMTGDKIYVVGILKTIQVCV